MAPVAVPTGFVTVTGPVVAPDGTVVVIEVAETTVNVAVVPLNFTPVTPVKLDPVMVTAVPTGPMVGENDVITGSPMTKLAALTPVLIGVVTLIFPVVAPAGTVAVICVGEFTVNAVAFVALNFTTDALHRFVPVMVTTVVPAVPNAGLNPVTVGTPAAVYVKGTLSVSGPVGLVTCTTPVVEHGAVVAMWVPSVIVKVAATPLNVTDVTFPFWKFVPRIVTPVPGGPVFGVKLVTVGVAA
jgi:hypothetical protein